MSTATAIDSVEMLRRAVLQAHDGSSSEIATMLRVMGYPNIGWVQVKGASIRAYLGGQEPDRPPSADALLEGLGGVVKVGSSPVDHGWYEWSWVAPLVPVVHGENGPDSRDA